MRCGPRSMPPSWPARPLTAWRRPVRRQAATRRSPGFPAMAQCPIRARVSRHTRDKRVPPGHGPRRPPRAASAADGSPRAADRAPPAAQRTGWLPASAGSADAGVRADPAPPGGGPRAGPARPPATRRSGLPGIRRRRSRRPPPAVLPPAPARNGRHPATAARRRATEVSAARSRSAVLRRAGHGASCTAPCAGLCAPGALSSRATARTQGADGIAAHRGEAADRRAAIPPGRNQAAEAAALQAADPGARAPARA